MSVTVHKCIIPNAELDAYQNPVVAGEMVITENSDDSVDINISDDYQQVEIMVNETKHCYSNKITGPITAWVENAKLHVVNRVAHFIIDEFYVASDDSGNVWLDIRKVGIRWMIKHKNCGEEPLYGSRIFTK